MADHLHRDLGNEISLYSVNGTQLNWIWIRKKMLSFSVENILPQMNSTKKTPPTSRWSRMIIINWDGERIKLFLWLMSCWLKLMRHATQPSKTRISSATVVCSKSNKLCLFLEVFKTIMSVFRVGWSLNEKCNFLLVKFHVIPISLLCALKSMTMLGEIEKKTSTFQATSMSVKSFFSSN